jgi:26S proteasome regulatory subunit N10
MKKNNTSIDIINFGEDTVNTSKLEAFMDAIGTDTSHLATIPPGPYLLSSMIQTPILTDEAPDMGVMGGMDGDASGFEFGIDPSLDPELALALRMSLEEEQARQAAEAAKQAQEAPGDPLPTVPEESEKRDGDGDGQGGGNMQIDR